MIIWPRGHACCHYSDIFIYIVVLVDIDLLFKVYLEKVQIRNDKI